ncbi:Actin-related protein [Cynara cardunculus var. scolymus]|uniref:Actin-related protein n=1 Tax=Cynara cardunculus var. scolymus TaxID=59895 RepID=A0A103YEN4_CYNCS|nr:Actin-related protein [Cynara cardunculus var. scolymus]
MVQELDWAGLSYKAHSLKCQTSPAHKFNEEPKPGNHHSVLLSTEFRRTFSRRLFQRLTKDLMEAVVIDAGSKLLKAGFAIPDQAPSMIIPTQMKIMNEDGSLPDSPSLQANNVDPVVRGFVKDWDAMEDLLHHVLYNGLGWEIGNEGQILFADPLLTPKAVREQLVQLMFETFNISGFYASEQAVLSLYAVGRISGCTVDIGHGKIDIAPVIEGAVQHVASRRLEIGGADLTKLFAQELAKSNPQLKLDVISIKRERFTVGEALFQPSILGLETHGIVEQLVRIISTVSSENHRQLLENTVLCGGTASMAGFEDRFQREASLCSSSIRPSLVKAPEYMPENLSMYSAWVGGAILAKVIMMNPAHLSFTGNASEDVVKPKEGRAHSTKLCCELGRLVSTARNPVIISNNTTPK